jgi:K+-sensing histidine kinase KdpD
MTRACDTAGGRRLSTSASILPSPHSERRGRDRSGLGLGLSQARKAVEAQGGDIHTRNIRGKGCIFVIEGPSFLTI